MTTKEKLFLIKETTEKEMNDYSLDFVSDYEIDSSSYLSDAFTEWADNNISIFYSDQFNYYEEHATECEDALLELYDGESIADKIKKEGLYNLCCLAGVCGQYNEITGDLYEDEERIKKLLVVRYLIKHDLYNLSDEELDELLDEAESANINRIDELLDIIKNYTDKD